MKRVFALVLILAAAALVAAEDKDKSKPNTLTPKEVADGWILLFDGETTFGWQSPNGSKWTIAQGMLAPQADKAGLLVTTTAFANYELQFDYIRGESTSAPAEVAQLRVGCDGKGKTKIRTNHYVLESRGKGWTTMAILVKDGRIQQITGSGTGLMANFRQVIQIPKEQTAKQSGFIAFAGDSFVLRNIKLKPTDMKPLFNGKDLTGWKKFTGDEKRAKTEFGVTPEGWLHLKNGPGDLQTTDLFGDFVLQAECRTNGKHLNSGIFFRCIPGEYQNGYEAQIHNGYTDKPAKEYTIEEYDPKTHELKNKTKQKATAIDYGTGAIYRRVPARFQASQDNEWFTMTVVAEGRHIATWVNGIQMVDWTDNRPLKDNPRNGCRLEKGAISLQGHDPTTDLSFRNIRLAELPPEKK